MSETLWFYAHDDKRLGPLDFEHLVGLLLTGQIPQSSLVWHQGLQQWTAAERIPEIADHLPPPLPPAKTVLAPSAEATQRPAAPPPRAAASSPRVDELRRRLEKEPGSRLFAQLAEELRKEGDLEEAIAVSLAGLHKHPSYTSGRMTLGRALLDNGDLEAAKATFEAALQGAPDNILAREFLEQCVTRLAESPTNGGGLAGTRAPEPEPPLPPEVPEPPLPLAVPEPEPVAPLEAPMEAAGDDPRPIPLAPAEENWELAAPYEIAAPQPPAPVAAPSAPPTVAGVARPPLEEPAPEGPPAPAADARPKATLPEPPPPADVPPAMAPTPAGSPDAVDLHAGVAPDFENLPTTGSLAECDFADLIHALSARRWTGTIDLHRGRVDTSVQVRDGRLIFASSTNRDERLGELLLRREKITLRQYYDASKAIRKGKRLGGILVEQGALKPLDLVNAVVDHTQEIIYNVFQWTEGFYQLLEGPDQGETITLKLSTADVILEGIRRIQAWSRIERGVGGPGARYARTEDYQERLQRVSLIPKKLLLVGDLGGERDVASICQGSKLGDFEVCRTLWAFRVIGLVRRVDAPHPLPPP